MLPNKRVWTHFEKMYGHKPCLLRLSERSDNWGYNNEFEPKPLKWLREIMATVLFIKALLNP